SDLRPDVCRACIPGDGACLTARAFFGIGPSNLPPGPIDARQPVS
ncbi:YkgJ family cysteine cluster protein, partial [Rhizobium ruizarguesonis]